MDAVLPVAEMANRERRRCVERNSAAAFGQGVRARFGGPTPLIMMADLAVVGKSGPSDGRHFITILGQKVREKIETDAPSVRVSESKKNGEL